jgi:hypothetical protein
MGFNHRIGSAKASPNQGADIVLPKTKTFPE